jgi:RND family efflux transporter MFP subunit
VHYKRYVFVALLAGACTTTAEVQESATPLPSLNLANQEITVRTGSALEEVFTYDIEGSGTIMAQEHQTVSLTKSGILSLSNLHQGQFVEKGTLLAKIDTKSARFDLERAHNALYRAQIDFDNQMLGYRNLQDSLEKQRVRENLAFKTGLRDAQISVKQANLELQKSYVYAPFSGRIANLSVRNGAYITGGTKLCELVGTNDLLVEFFILEKEVNKLLPGQQIKLKTLSSGQASIPAKLIEINPIVEFNGMIKVRGKILENAGLLPGMRARATVSIPITKSVVVPKEAVVYRGDRPVVFTKDNNIAIWNYVTTGAENATHIQILEGLQPGAEVIVSNNLQLGHEAPIIVEKLPADHATR